MEIKFYPRAIFSTQIILLEFKMIKKKLKYARVNSSSEKIVKPIENEDKNLISNKSENEVVNEAIPESEDKKIIKTNNEKKSVAS